MMKAMLAALSCLVVLPLAEAQGDIGFAPGDPQTDALVDRCLGAPGVSFLEGTDVLCYNGAIFPEQFLQLNDLPPASRIIITSPGGNVATARVMSTILDQRGEPAVIAGPCMSACAMVLLPGLDRIHIHHTAHIAVHGITMMDFRTWWGWLRQDKTPPGNAVLLAQMGYDFGYTLHNSGRSHMKAHLDGQEVSQDFIETVSDTMLEDARQSDCRVDPKAYWGMLDAGHLQRFLGARITRMEAFAQTWEDPRNTRFQSLTEPIGERTYIFSDDFDDAVCD